MIIEKELTLSQIAEEIDKQLNHVDVEELLLILLERMTVEEIIDIINIAQKINKGKLEKRIDAVLERTRQDDA